MSRIGGANYPTRWTLPALTSLVVAAGIAVISTALISWSLAVVLTLYLVIGALPVSFHLRASKRLAIFFGLLAVSDFLKRVVFLGPEQEPWSQYLVWLFPHVYYVLLILLPWLLSRSSAVLTVLRRGWPVAGFILVALLNTWLAPGFSLLLRLAATFLLIVPWTMALVASSYPDALVPVCRITVAAGVMSAAYGLWQFAFGPTPVELNWALATSDFSIGATHLAWVIEGVPGFFFWRVVGFQADSFTFGMFVLSALAALLILRAAGTVGPAIFLVGTFGFSLAILVSLVRTVWVSWAAFLLFRRLFYRVGYLRRPVVLTAAVIGMFLGAGPVADYLYNLAPRLADTVSDPALQRALTVGTLEARRGALEQLVGSLPNLWLSGYGYAASDWIAAKFGREASLPPNFSAHNGLVELMWYTGIPGVVLFLSAVYVIFGSARRAWAAAGKAERRVLATLSAYMVAVLVSGLGNGGAFWGYYLFFTVGILLAGRGDLQLPVRSRATNLEGHE